MTDAEFKELLDQPEVKALIARDDLASVYDSIDNYRRGYLSNYLLNLKPGISAEEIMSYFGSTIPEYAFFECNKLKSTSIPQHITTIDYSAFRDCDSLTSVVIPDSVDYIGGCAFIECKSLKSIVIPDSVIEIGHDAFAGCDSLTSVTFGENSQLEAIGHEAFIQCFSLTSIVIPKSVTIINYSTFTECTSLTSVTIPENMSEIQESAFAACRKLKDVYFNGSREQWEQIEIGKFNSALSRARKHFAK